MTPSRVVIMFEQERTWLEEQPGMVPWDQGCHGLIQQLQEWLTTYSEVVCESVVTGDHEAWLEHTERLWQCLAHHWRQAAEINGGVDVGAVAKQIQNGRGYQRGGQLGGDPMRDVVLAVAMTSRDEKAPIVFQNEYYVFSRGLAGKLNRRLADNPDEWWNDLVDHLAGYTKPPGKLTKFFGRSALQNWLGTVQWNFLRRWVQREWKTADTENIEDVAQSQTTSDNRTPLVDESLQCFVDIVRQALADMSQDDVLLLYYVDVKGLKQKDVAAIFRIAPGNITRRRQKALDRLKEAIERAGPRLFGRSSDAGIREEIMEDTSSFADALRKAIEQAQEERS